MKITIKIKTETETKTVLHGTPYGNVIAAGAFQPFLRCSATTVV